MPVALKTCHASSVRHALADAIEAHRKAIAAQEAAEAAFINARSAKWAAMDCTIQCEKAVPQLRNGGNPIEVILQAERDLTAAQAAEEEAHGAADRAKIGLETAEHDAVVASDALSKAVAGVVAAEGGNLVPALLAEIGAAQRVLMVKGVVLDWLINRRAVPPEHMMRAVEIQRFLDINPRGWPGVRDVANACDAAAEALVRDPDAPLALPLKD